MELEELLPGTERLIDERQSDQIPLLKRDGEIVLWPQPTDSPNDPLLWYVSIVCDIRIQQSLTTQS